MKPIVFGLLATAFLLGLYFTLLILISGSDFAVSQFSQYWFFIVSLAVGFGIQIGLYTYLRRAIKNAHGTGKTVAVSGTTSTLAMISCCSHYLINILPIIGVTGLISIISQYQLQLFWFGLGINFLGILYIFNRVVKFQKEAKKPACCSHE